MELKDIFRYFRNNVPKVSLRYKKPILNFEKVINKPTDAVDLIRSHYDSDALDLKEHMWIILLSSSNKVIGIANSTVGGFNNVQTNTREITQLGLISNAGKIILIHNHPGDYAYPSKKDIIYTQELKNVLEIFEIGLMDHIIVTTSSYYSFNGNNKLI